MDKADLDAYQWPHFVACMALPRLSQWRTGACSLPARRPTSPALRAPRHARSRRPPCDAGAERRACICCPTVSTWPRSISARRPGRKAINEILRRVAERGPRNAKPGEGRVLGRGYDHNELAEKRHPTAEELDRVAPNNPVYIKRTCGHVAGSPTRAALREAGIGHNTPSPGWRS